MEQQQEISPLRQHAIFALLGYQLLETANAKGQPYKWRHVVYSGFNQAFRQYFSGVDPKTCLDALDHKGLIKVTLARGGAAFVPQPSLLRELSEIEREEARRIHHFFTDFIASQAAKKEKNGKKRSDEPREEQAEKLWAAGDRETALKILGFFP